MSHIGSFSLAPNTNTFGAIYTMTCDTGTVLVDAGNIDIAGDSINITTSGAGSTITVSLNNDVAIQGQLKCNAVDIQNGNLFVDTGVIVLGILGPQLLSGSGNPNGIVTAPQGSLYLNSTGTHLPPTRAFINTDSGTTWTAITTSS